jgi:hypothetical protein
MGLQCIFIYNHHKDTSITFKTSADITYNNEQHACDRDKCPVVNLKIEKKKKKKKKKISII